MENLNTFQVLQNQTVKINGANFSTATFFKALFFATCRAKCHFAHPQTACRRTVRVIYCEVRAGRDWMTPSYFTVVGMICKTFFPFLFVAT
jgi:hypothetical protein